jgi:hypothetical protein
LGNERLAVVWLASQIFKSPDTHSISVSSGDPAIDYCSSHFLKLTDPQLRALDKNVLYQILASPLLRIESEDQLLQKLIDLGEAYMELWGCIEVRFLSANSLSIFSKRLTFNFVTETVWKKVLHCLNKVSDKELLERRFCGWGRSEILSDFPSIFDKFRFKKWNLLYRGTRDGFGSGAFHTRCDGHANTLTIILTTKGYVFGGFSPISWDSSNAYKADMTKESFLFSLISPRSKEPQKFPLLNTSYALYCSTGHGPTFGNGHDIYVANGANSNTSSYTSLGSGYVNSTGITAQQVFTGEYNFQVKEIEVFSIKL